MPSPFRLSPIVCLTVLCLGTIVGAQSTESRTSAQEPDEGDELLMYEDLPVVITATRTPTPINLAPVPVSIIGADDIRYGGQTNLAEVLQFANGVDVLSYDRMRYQVGIRGLHEVFSDRTITLINGRNASSPVFGGTEFIRLPVLMADIERIEVVRGPGGAAWGANAFNGVINIITKDPDDVAGTYVELGATHFGDHYGHLRWAGTGEDLAWRISAGYQGVLSSDEALDDDSFRARDQWEAARLDTEFRWQTAAGTRVSTGAADPYFEQGSFDSGFFDPGGTGRMWKGRAFLRTDSELKAGSSGYLQLFANLEGTDIPSLGVFSAQEYDLEGQLDQEFAKDHRLTIGGNVRHVHIDESSNDPQQLTLVGEPFDELWAGLFAIDRMAVNDSTTLELQLRGDYYSENDVDWSGRISSFFGLDGDRRHTLRASVAKAFRTPLTGLRTFSTQRLPVGPTFLIQNVPGGDLDNEQIYSFELGHTFKASKAWSVRLDTYYQRFEDLIGFRTLGGPAPLILTFDNIDGAEGYGAELEVSWRRKDGSVAAWYSFQELSTDQGSQSVRAFLPARYKAGLTARAILPGGLIGNLNYKYSGPTPSETTGETVVDEFHRIDLTLTKSFMDERGELLIGVADLLNDTEFTVPGTTLSGLSPGSGTHDTPGITFFVTMRLRM